MSERNPMDDLARYLASARESLNDAFDAADEIGDVTDERTAHALLGEIAALRARTHLLALAVVGESAIRVPLGPLEDSGSLKTRDLGNNEQISTGVVLQHDGTYLALTPTRSRTFKTERGARNWYNRMSGDADRCEHGMFRSGAGACPQCGGGAS